MSKIRCPRCDSCGFEEDENYEHSTCSVCIGMGYLIEAWLPGFEPEEDEMNDGQKQTVNHVYHFLKNLKYHYDIGSYLCNGRKPNDTNLKSMIWYLETNFPKDMLKHEMGEDESRYPISYSEKMQDDLEPIEGDEDG